MDDAQLDLQKVGCSSQPQTTTWGEVFGDHQPLTAFSYVTSFLPFIIGFAISVALYGIVRAIGWVVGGFAAL